MNMDKDSDSSSSMQPQPPNSPVKPNDHPHTTPANSSASTNHRLADLTSRFLSLTTTAETQLQHLPLPTQRALSTETRALFRHYAKHGSQIRLSQNLASFLNATPDSTLTFSTPPPPTVPTPVFHPDSRVTRSHDPESSELVTTLPFHAVDTELKLPMGTHLPPELFTRINKIYALHNHFACALLRHHVGKYGPEPLFRVGIREYVASMVGDLLTSAGQHELGLTPETRGLLRSVFEENPQPNTMEIRFLAQVCRVSVDSVKYFFESLLEQRKAYYAMRIYISARELEREKAWKYQEFDRAMHAHWDQAFEEDERMQD